MEPRSAVGVVLGPALISAFTSWLLVRRELAQVARHNDLQRQHRSRMQRSDKLEREFVGLKEAIGRLQSYDANLGAAGRGGVADQIDTSTGEVMAAQYWTEPVERAYERLMLWAPGAARDAARRHLDAFYARLYLVESNKDRLQREQEFSESKTQLIAAMNKALGADVD